MNITRCKDQKSMTLEEFYTDLSQSKNQVTNEIGKTMCYLLSRLRELPNNFQVYGLTSHARLCLLSQDTHKSPRYVTVTAINSRNIVIEYLMPDDTAPWPAASVKGQARSEDDAVRMIETAMQNSRGWIRD